MPDSCIYPVPVGSANANNAALVNWMKNRENYNHHEAIITEVSTNN